MTTLQRKRSGLRSSSLINGAILMTSGRVPMTQRTFVFFISVFSAVSRRRKRRLQVLPVAAPERVVPAVAQHPLERGLASVAKHLPPHVTRVSRDDLGERFEARRRRYEKAVELPRGRPASRLAQPRRRGAHSVVPGLARAFEHLGVVPPPRAREESHLLVELVLEYPAGISQFGAYLRFG